ncbi:MAG: MOSC domain-containing protein [Ferruginibacter sp.]|nr:MOSC domain-containing protein [Cytophagales bacterium]
MYTLSNIYLYPIKSLGGISLTSADVEERGLQHDRRWMLTDPSGRFLTQRNFPEMALLDVEMTATGLGVRHRKQPLPLLTIPFAPSGAAPVRVVVWDDVCQALPVSREADEWFSTALGKPCRLVRMPDDSVRRVDADYVAEPFNTSFSDGYPLLIIGQASLDHLNARLPAALPMNRFRPNLVFTGGEPHEEDTWRHFRVGEAEFRGVKPCGRCVVTTIDQQTAEQGLEPLRTLATYRKQGRKILFGQNLVALSGGTVRVGDTVEVREKIGGS